jgi:transposase InsO family protein
VIFQLIDDHSRYAVASHVASGETAEAAIAVFDNAVAAHGVPQRLLSDNGVALNPSRRGFPGQVPGKQPLASTLAELQAQVDAYVGNGRPRGPRPKSPESSPKS